MPRTPSTPITLIGSSPAKAARLIPVSPAAAAHCVSPNPKRLSVGRDGTSAVRCSGKIETSSERHSHEHHLTSTVAVNGVMQINCQKEEHQMANLRHPTDASIEDLSFVKLELVRDFTEDDGVICEKEYGILIQFDEAVARLRRMRSIERATELLMKQEQGKISRFTRQRFEEAGMHIDPLDAA